MWVCLMVLSVIRMKRCVKRDIDGILTARGSQSRGFNVIDFQGRERCGFESGGVICNFDYW